MIITCVTTASLTAINNLFTKDKPIIWYGKSNKGEIEYFNSRGAHSITKKELKPITKYIIDKYIFKNN